jgi:hypothetical protein
MAVWHGPEGIEVEVIVLGRRTCLRVSQRVRGRRFHVAYCNLAQLARYVDPADLCEVIPFPVGSARRVP